MRSETRTRRSSRHTVVTEPLGEVELDRFELPARVVTALGRVMGYDAFVSYSHAADGHLAPALQRGLERLARPWYRPRASSIFRDETGLAVSPHLWASIVSALDDSEWFVVLCSPEAAGSEWVEREVVHWLAHKSPDRILLVLTEGDLVWDGNRDDFDRVRSTALPPALLGQFGDEPRHLDLRWARGEEQLDLRHARFRPAVAELAAPIRNMARDELEAEDVRQHRRTVRLARGATTVVVLLSIVALTFGALALQQRSDARNQAANARREAQHARQAANSSLARGLAAEALNALHDGQPDLAQLLAVQAYRTEPSVYSRSSLLQAVVDQPALAVQLHGLTSGPDTIALSADGRLVAAESGSTIRLWDRRSGRLLARQPSSLGAGSLTFADRGRLLLSALYSPVGRLAVWDVARGRLLEQVPTDESAAASADASTFASLGASGVVRMFDLRTGKSLGSIDAGQSGTITVSADGKTVADLSPALTAPGGQAVIGVRAWSVAKGVETGPGCSVASSGTPSSPTILGDDVTVAFASTALAAGDTPPPTALFRCDVRTAGLVSRSVAPDSDQGFSAMSPDATVVALRSAAGTIQLEDATNGNLIGGAIDAPLTERMALSTFAFSPDGRWFTATGSGGDVRVWRTGTSPPLSKQVDLGSKFESQNVYETPSGRVIGVAQDGEVIDVDTHQSLGRIPGASLTSLSADGRLLAGDGPAGLSVLDLRRHSTDTVPAGRLACKQADAIGIAPDDKTLVLDCIGPFATSPDRTNSNAQSLIQVVDISSSPWRPQPPITFGVWASLLTFSPDGRVLAAGEGSGAGSGLELFDVAGTTLHPRVKLAGYGDDVVFTPDSRALYWSHDGRIDRVALRKTGVRVSAFAPPNGGPTSGISLTPDGSLLAASDGSASRLWDTGTSQVVGDIPGSANPPCCSVLAISVNALTGLGGLAGSVNPASNDVILTRFALDSNDLIGLACTRANRNLSRAEWTQYVGTIPYREQCPAQ